MMTPPRFLLSLLCLLVLSPLEEAQMTPTNAPNLLVTAKPASTTGSAKCGPNNPAACVKAPGKATCGAAPFINSQLTFSSHAGFGSWKYSKNMKCTWYIVAPKGKKLKIVFNYFYLGARVKKCAADHLDIYEGLTTFEGSKIGRFCGNKALPFHVTAVTGTATLVFETNGKRTHEGFQAHVKWVSGEEGNHEDEQKAEKEKEGAAGGAVAFFVVSALVIVGAGVWFVYDSF